MEHNLIEVENLSFIVDNKVILDDLSFKLREGESLGLYSPTGSGKSFLLNMLRDTKGHTPSKGNIYYTVSYCPLCKDILSPSHVGGKSVKNATKNISDTLKRDQATFDTTESKIRDTKNLVPFPLFFIFFEYRYFSILIKRI